jgi:hypothetical protein
LQPKLPLQKAVKAKSESLEIRRAHQIQALQ